MSDGHVVPTSAAMTRKQRLAVRTVYLRENTDEPTELNASVVTDETWMDAYTAFVNHQTARALERRGLLHVEPCGDEVICGLTAAGRSLAEEMIRRQRV